MNIAVYLGANEGKNPVYREKVEELGTWIGTSGNSLIYGGSRTGLMGHLARCTLAAGGQVIGVEPQFFVDGGFQKDDLTELIVTPDMPSRKAEMIRLAELFIAFPGGTGTAEEISEVISMGSLGLTEKKYGYYNVNGFYDSLKEQYDIMVREGFMSQENREKIYFFDTLDEIAHLVADNLMGKG